MRVSDLSLTFDPGGEGRRDTTPFTVTSPNYSNISSETTISSEDDITSNHATSGSRVTYLTSNMSDYLASDDAATLFPPGDGTQAAVTKQSIPSSRRWNSCPKGKLKDSRYSEVMSHSTEMPSIRATASRGEQPAPCRYIDPLTGIKCDVIPSRSYDMARHLHVHVKREEEYERSSPIAHPFPRLRDADNGRLLELGIPQRSVENGNAMRTIRTGESHAQPGQKRKRQATDTHVRRRRCAHEVSSESGPSSGAAAAASATSVVPSAEAPLPIAEDLFAWMPIAESAVWPATAAFPIDLLGAPTGATSSVAQNPAPSSSPVLMDHWDALGLQHPMPRACLCTGSACGELIKNEVSGHKPSQPFFPPSPTGWGGWYSTTSGYY